MRYSPRMGFEQRLALIRRGPDDCWLWLWAKTPRGYGHFRRNTLDEYAHRAAYELLVGPIPKTTEIDHLCLKTSCCNPNHMVPRTKKRHRQRHADMQKRCCRGHQLHPEQPDTYYTFSNGRRACRLCYEGWNAVRWNPKASEAYRLSGGRKKPSPSRKSA